MKNSVVGKWAEDIAAHFLERKGYKILERNFNTRFGELDIVAGGPEDVGIVFTEVRYRGKGSYLLPEETLTIKKQKRLKTASTIYMNKFGLVDPFVRFDVICISKDSWFKPVKVQHIIDVF